MALLPSQAWPVIAGARPSDVSTLHDVEAPTLEELQRWRSRMGPKLRALVRSQQDKHPPVRCMDFFINTTALSHAPAVVSLAQARWRWWYR